MNIRVPQEKTPLFDLTSMLAVEALFRDVPQDPWLNRIVSNLTDLFIFSEQARVAVPYYSNTLNTLEEGDMFRVLNLLRRRDPNLIHPVIYRTDEQISLNPEFLDRCFSVFSKWARNNRRQMKSWLQFHREPWISSTHSLRYKTKYLYATHTLMNTPEFNILVKTLAVSPEEIYYAFDLVLRYSLLGQIAGENQHYLAHPIREEQQFPTMQFERGESPHVPVHIGKAIAPVIHKFTMDQYAEFLNETRGIVREMGITEMKPNTIEKDTLRELATRLWLPPKLRSWGKLHGLLAGLITGIGTYPALGPISAGLGAGVSIAATFWSGNLPRTAARIRWLRWAFEWDIEQEARSKP